MLSIYIKLAIRNFLKNRVYSFLIIGGFAIGFAACIMIGLFYHNETTVNQNFAKHKQIYRIYDVKQNRCNLNWDLFPLLISTYAAVEDACPLDYQEREQMTIKVEQTKNNAEIRHLLSTTNNFFSIFSIEILESISDKPLESNESVAISSPLAKSLFGTQSPLGQKVNIGNYFFATVSSVFSPFPVNSSFRADIILNSENKKFRFSTTSTNGNKYNPTNHFVLLKDGTNHGSFAEELNKSINLRQLSVDSLALQSLDDIYLSELTIKSRHTKGNPVLLKVFFAIAILILILSSINYLNYSVSMHYTKFRETGIKMTFGAEWKDLVKHTLVEVSLGIMISLILSFIITDTALSFSDRLFGKDLDIQLKDLLAVTPVFILTVIAVILLNSFAPLYFLSKYNIIGFLSGSGIKRNEKQIWKQTLLTFQLTVSIALIAVVIGIFKQLGYTRHTDSGFNNNLLLRINIPYRFQQTKTMIQELEKLPIVSETTLSSGCPGMINHRMDSDISGKNVTVNCIYVGNNYLNTMDMKLLAGRNFMEGDLKKTCLINEEALKQFGWDTFEGKRYEIGQEGGLEVIGIIKDFKFASFHQKVEPLALVYNGADNGNVLSVRLTRGNTGQQINLIMKVWKSVSPDEPLSFIFYDDFFQSFYEKEEKLASSITFFSFIAIALTCMGILGQIFMICLTRVKEIGIRKINGAKIFEILFFLNYDFLKWFAVAFFIATPVSWFVCNKWLENFAYKTSLSWWIFVLSGLVAFFIIIVTVSWQSWRAATRNPVEALRYE
jgi:putative ABC transport system permease protein